MPGTPQQIIAKSTGRRMTPTSDPGQAARRSQRGPRALSFDNDDDDWNHEEHAEAPTELASMGSPSLRTAGYAARLAASSSFAGTSVTSSSISPVRPGQNMPVLRRPSADPQRDLMIERREHAETKRALAEAERQHKRTLAEAEREHAATKSALAETLAARDATDKALHSEAAR